jgi:hypothetical protein
MEIHYLVNNKKYLDVYMIQKRLSITKSFFQNITKNHPNIENEALFIQNRKLYSIDSILKTIKNIKNEYEHNYSITQTEEAKEV